MHGGLSKGKKILNFFDLTKAHTDASGHAMKKTLQRQQPHSRSRMLHDASHHHTADHKIPKVRGEVRSDTPGSSALSCLPAGTQSQWIVYPGLKTQETRVICLSNNCTGGAFKHSLSYTFAVVFHTIHGLLSLLG